MNALITQNLSTLALAVQNKSASGRGSGKKIDLYGIKKLRELILELAVRGKLVAQNPEDEPASKLLERIGAETAKLVREKQIKKLKKLPDITESEQPFELPTAWEWARLGDVTNYGTCDKAEPADVEAHTWVLELEDVEKVTSRLLQRIHFKDRQFKSSKNKFNAGDVLYGKLRPYLDKVLVADKSGVCTTEMIPFRAYAAISPFYLRMVMKSPYFISYANASTHGMNLPRMGTDKARLALIPITAESQQHRIVAKVDELMALCDQIEQQTEASLSAHTTLVENLLATLTNSANAEELKQNWQRIASHFTTLFTTEASIDQLKQTILQLAVMGKLVPQDPNDEPAAKLLERITAEKAQLVKEGKIKKQKPLPPITEDEKPFELPVGWEWCRLGELSKLVTSGSRGWKAYYASEGATFIRSQDIKFDRVEFDERAFVNLPEKTEGVRTKVDVGNILITITGANVAKAAILEDNIDEAYVSQHVALIKLITDNLNRYIHLWLTGEHGGRKILLESSYGAKPGLNLQNINELLIPIAPTNESERIVHKVDQLMTLCDQIKTHLQHQQQTRLHLADAMVAQALNPNNPNSPTHPKAANP